jgi:DNA polymerase
LDKGEEIMLEEEKNLPDTEIRVREKDISPMFNDEAGKVFQEKVVEYLKSKDIDMDKLDSYSKIKVIQKMIRACKRCELRKECKEPMEPWIPTDNPKAGFIVRNPSSSESKVGVPLHPEAPGGYMFLKYLDILGLSRNQIYVSNIIHCKANKNQTNQFEYISTCSLWKLFELQIINTPKYIFTMGSYPLKMFMGMNHPSILNIFGDIYKVKLFDKDTYIIPITHPGYLLRTSEFRGNTDKLLKYVRTNLIEEKG